MNKRIVDLVWGVAGLTAVADAATVVIVDVLVGSKTADALAAEVVYQKMNADLLACLNGIASGRELVERGFADDVNFAAQLDISDAVPILTGGSIQCA